MSYVRDADPSYEERAARRTFSDRLHALVAGSWQAMLMLGAHVPSQHQRPRHLHDSGCQCHHCGRWRQIERHGPRGRPGGGGI
jgi:hypothetical protein